MTKPIIGIVPLVDFERESYWMLPGYMGGVSQAGGIPVMLPLTSDNAELRQLVDSLDGFLIAGGQDVCPETYGEDQIEACGQTCPARDEMESKLFYMALGQDKPVLGICRGIQMINAILGGTLYQDLPTEHPSELDHHQQPPYDEPSHVVKVVPGSPLEALLAQDAEDMGEDGLSEDGCLAVNSYHHQAVKELAPGLETMAYSEDGLVEAFREPSRPFVWGIQWHPELSYEVDEASRRIFGAFVKAAEAARV